MRRKSTPTGALTKKYKLPHIIYEIVCGPFVEESKSSLHCLVQNRLSGSMFSACVRNEYHVLNGNKISFENCLVNTFCSYKHTKKEVKGIQALV